MRYQVKRVSQCVLWFALACVTQQSTLAQTNGLDKLESKTESVNSPEHSISDHSGTLTLEQVQRLTLKHNAQLRALYSECRALEGDVRQASLPLNPELTVETENFGGENELRRFQGAETTVSVSQVFELGGKRQLRHQLAGLERDLVNWDLQLKKRDVLAAASQGFFKVMVAQEVLQLNMKLLKVAEQTASAVTEKVNAGKVSPIEKLRADMEAVEARTAIRKSKSDLDSARNKLAVFWGDYPLEYNQVVGELETLPPLPNLDNLMSNVENNALFQRWRVETQMQDVLHKMAQSEVKPDLSIQGGVRFLNESNSKAYVLGLSLPLPFLNRQQGAIAKTLAKKEQSANLRLDDLVRFRKNLSVAWRLLSTAYAEAVALRDELLPLAQQAFEATDLGYREGKLDFLKMLESQRTLFTAKRQYLRSLETYHQNRIEMNRLTENNFMDQDGTPAEGEME